MRTLFCSMLVGLTLWCGCTSINLGTSACASAGGECAAFPTGCACGKWSPTATCASADGVSRGCCMPGSCASGDMGPQVCLVDGLRCARNSDCCSNDCPERGAAFSVCGSGSGGGGGTDLCSANGARCVLNTSECTRGHIEGNCSGESASWCCVPGPEPGACGSQTCGVGQICVQPCYYGISCFPKNTNGLCPPGTALQDPSCTVGGGGGLPACTPNGQPVCRDLPASCDLTSPATACGCFPSDPCSVGVCAGGVEGAGTVSCFCPNACDTATVDAFVAAHKSCVSDQDCVAMCTLGASCDVRSVNKAGAAAFPTTFGGCPFPQCRDRLRSGQMR